MHELREALLEWYDRSARDLPWRRTRDPYAIWVSEVMLQQTRVETVIPYYERFLRRFPTLSDLAAADEDAVLAAFSGLGYYRRARLLHAGVRDVVARYAGEVPEDPSARRSLPGIGRYTSGAIGSIAFGRAEPLVDGNVARVLSRIVGIDTPLGAAITEKQLWSEAERWVEGPRPGDLNQALMELGATICLPTTPRCEACPVSSGCYARKEGRTADLPVPKPRKEPLPLALAAVLAWSAEDGGRFWLGRSSGTLFGGMYGLPMHPVESSLREAAEQALRNSGIEGELDPKPRGTVSHVLSHRRLTVTVFAAVQARAEPTAERREVTLTELEGLGVSRLTRKLLDAAGIDIRGADPYERSSSGGAGTGRSKEGPRPTSRGASSSKKSTRRRSKSATAKQG